MLLFTKVNHDRRKDMQSNKRKYPIEELIRHLLAEFNISEVFILQTWPKSKEK